jgi:hypothetical protein
MLFIPLGGAVLRSKTADFERLSDHTKKTRKSSLATTMPTITQSAVQTERQLSSPNVTNINISLTAKKKTDSIHTSATDSRKGPIYKRQELISSVHSKTTKK